MEQLIETLRTQRDLSDEELTALITRESDDKDLFGGGGRCPAGALRN